MLWDEIFNFFIIYVFGGTSSDGTQYSGTLGALYNADDDVFENAVDTANSMFFKFDYNGTWWLSIGNYFSLIATIITIVAILLFCVFIIKKIIGIIFRLFTGSSLF